MAKFQPDNVDLIKWFNELEKQPTARVFRLTDVSYIIYKGFKMVRNNVKTPTNKDYFMYDMTVSSIDVEVKPSHISSMKTHGVIKGIDIISMKRMEVRLSLKLDELEDVKNIIKSGSTSNYHFRKLEELEAETASLSMHINKTINKYKLNGK